MNRRRWCGPVVGAMALVLVSCGGGADDATGVGDPEAASIDSLGDAPNEATAASEATGAGEATGVDDAAGIDGSYSLGIAADDPTAVMASELAVLLVEQLGDDAVAVGAVLRAGDKGYDGLQIGSAIVAANLLEDGTVKGVDPRLSASDKISGFRSAPSDDDLLPIEQLRRSAAEGAGQQDHWPTGAQATAVILALHLGGYSQEQIVDILILGAVQLDGTYDGPIAAGEEECGGFVIGGTHEIPRFCDPESGELFPDDEKDDECRTWFSELCRRNPTATAPEPSDQTDEESTDLCLGDFAPPYSGVPIEPVGALLETQILGPLDTPYYYTEVTGLLDIAADGSFTLSARTVRLGDITIRGEPDNQIYIREFDLSGTIDDAGDAAITGTISGTDQLWSGDAQTPVNAEAGGTLAVLCDDDEPNGFAIFGAASGQGLLEFEARP